jgi:anti-sigma B factor antagonist
MLDSKFPVRRESGVAVVAAPEEIDITNAGRLRTALVRACSNGDRTIVVDLSGTHFCDSAALNVLVRAHQRGEEQGREVRLVVPGPDILRIFAVTGINQVIPIFASMDEAIAPGLERVPAPPANIAVD